MQPPEVFLKISQISQENLVLESLFNKIAGLKAFFKNTYFEEHLRMTASQVFFNDFHQKHTTTIFTTLFDVFISFIVV